MAAWITAAVSHQTSRLTGYPSTSSMLDKILFTVQVIIPIVIDGKILYLLVGSSCEIKGIVAPSSLLAA